MAPSLLLAAVSVVLYRGSWLRRSAAIGLVSLWILAMSLELSDRSFIDVATLEFGAWYEISLMAAALIPALGIVAIAFRPDDGDPGRCGPASGPDRTQRPR